MKLKPPMKRWQWLALIAAVNLLLASSCTVIKPKKPTFALRMVSQLQVDGPCIASAIGPPEKGCIQWEPNVTAMPTYEPSRRLIFSGAADQLLHIIDADNGRPLTKIVTSGRVVTKTLFGQSNGYIYAGTDKGVLYAWDAYAYTPKFTFYADSKINNDLVLVNDLLIFTTSVGTIYCLDSNSGELQWQLFQPALKERLRLARQSNIVVTGDKENLVLVPHNDGYLLMIDIFSGKPTKRIEFGPTEAEGFPDIVAPMVVLKNRLWVASNDLGIAIIDLHGSRIRDQIDLKGILALATDGNLMFAATTDDVFALSENGKVIWRNNVATIKSRSPRASFPFERTAYGAKQLFYGMPTGILVNETQLMVATSLGSILVFDKMTGNVVEILGNATGSGPIFWAGTSSFMTVSKRGLLMRYQN